MAESSSPSPHERIPQLNVNGKVSLRNLEPEYWSADGKTISLRSVIQAYSVGPIETIVDPVIAQFVKESCRSARRLRTMSISAYETYASSYNIPSWAGIGAMTYVSLASGVSALDALACALWGILTGEVPQKETSIPALAVVKNNLANRGHRFVEPLAALLGADWCTQLHEARHRIVHRGFWPEVTDDGQFQFVQDLEEFRFGGRSEPLPKKTQRLNLPLIMRGLVSALETWDIGLAPLLKEYALYTPYSEEETVVSQISGQPSADWSLGMEVMSHRPTEAFIELWNQTRLPD